MTTKTKTFFVEIGLAVFLALFAGWYLLDTYRASADAENLLLIMPTALAVLILLLCVLVALVRKQLRTQDPEAVVAAKEEKEGATKKPISVFGAFLVFGAYILLMEKVGLDIATALFIAAMLYLQRERRLLWLVGFPILFAIPIALFFEYMLPFPLPMLLGKAVFFGG